MSDSRPGRREFLALAGTGLVGCSEPRAADAAMEGSSSHTAPIDPDNRADGSTHPGETIEIDCRRAVARPRSRRRSARGHRLTESVAVRRFGRPAGSINRSKPFER